jgi:hypothetical protein
MTYVVVLNFHFNTIPRPIPRFLLRSTMAYRVSSTPRINVDDPPRRSPISEIQSSPRSPSRPSFSRHSSASRVPIAVEPKPEPVSQLLPAIAQMSALFYPTPSCLGLNLSFLRQNLSLLTWKHLSKYSSWMMTVPMSTPETLQAPISLKPELPLII